MDVQTIKANWGDAYQLYHDYAEASTKSSDSYLKVMRRASWHMMRGRAIVDIFAAFKKAGLNAKGDPRLAIAPADFTQVRFRKTNPGGGYFYGRTRRFTLSLPEKSFSTWPQNEGRAWDLKRAELLTKVPIVPPKHVPAKLANYFTLWEVEDWDEVPSDPMLLARLNKNLFIVLATWDLTPLERALVNGR